MRRFDSVWALALLIACGQLVCVCVSGARVQPEQVLQKDQTITASAREDKVEALPGWGVVRGMDLYAGYVTVDDDAGRALFYTLAESQRDPATDPLVLWLNGGPGCSSIGGGFLSELGPFFPTEDGLHLEENPHSWNKVANVLFVESPAFVGFSYSNTSSDRRVGDARTANDTLKFLVRFLARFPQYVHRDFYISGESYAGHYVPQLAWAIYEWNQAHPNAAINMKGFLVGNAWTDPVYDNRGTLDYWWSHALISDESYDSIYKQCNFTQIGPLLSSEQDPNEDCENAVSQASDEMGDINVYEIYADVCMRARQAEKLAPASLAARVLKRRLAVAAERKQLRDNDPMYDPCVDNEVEDYLNMPAVQAALHANQTVKLPWRWQDCSDVVEYFDEDVFIGVLPVYRNLLGKGLRIVVYSGDVDGVVPVIGTRRWINALGLPTTRRWTPWEDSNGQVGGYAVGYQGLMFVTVRNAGHMVPYVQPERALDLFTWFLSKRTLEDF